MIMKIFSVFDTKVQAYMTPFFSATPGSAIRSFTDAAAGQDSIVAKHPEDFTLYAIGDFDDHTGAISVHEPHALGKASEYLQNGQTPIEEAAQ